MKVTTNHEEIRLWAQAHQANPEMIDPDLAQNTNTELRLNFPGKQDNMYLDEVNAEKFISWEDFFEKFDELGLAFQYDEKLEGNDVSNAYSFIKRAKE